MRKGPVTLSNDEVRQIIAMLEWYSMRCGEAYQVVGELADFASMTHDPAVVKAMDLLASPLWRGEILPFSPARAIERHRAYRSEQKWTKKHKAFFDSTDKEIEAERKGRRKRARISKSKKRS